MKPARLTAAMCTQRPTFYKLIKLLNIYDALITFFIFVVAILQVNFASHILGQSISHMFHMKFLFCMKFNQTEAGIHSDTLVP